MSTRLVRHFTFKHPLFLKRGRTHTGAHWKDSVCYLWWEFLRRHEGYRNTCENGGQGKFAAMYADFGDVHASDFKTCWTKGDRGAQLFAEPPIPQSVGTLNKSDLARLSQGWDETTLLLVSIPLRLPKAFIERRVAKLVRQHHCRKRGERLMTESRAKYPISTQFNIHSLKTILDVYDLRRKQPELALWEIAQRLRFTTTLKPEEIIAKRMGAHTAIKQSMASATSRKLLQGKKIIEGVGRGMFPAFSG
jgi:hypothetical protein